MNVAVYYLKESNNNLYLVREVHTIGKSEGVAKAALNELISGNVQTKGAYRVIPADTKILGVSIANGIATVDFSKEVLKANVGSAGEELGIMSIVNTLTEFPTVSSVQFTVEGNAGTAKDWWGHVGLSNQPFKRNINKVYEPVIWVNFPVSGQKVSSPITLQGTAIIFEATVNYHLKDSAGNLLAEGYVMANAGAPDRGDFQKSIEFKPSTTGKGTLEVFEVSPKDGSEINKVVIPLSW
jgi:Spore germination protein